MLRHYLAVALANCRRAPSATLTNVTTLALGLLSFIVAYAVVAFWAQADRQITHSDRTFAVSSRIVLANRSTVLRLSTITNHFVAEYLQADFPQIEAVARARTLGREAPVSAGDRAARLYAASVDPAFLSIFHLPFIDGDASAALSRPGSVVLTKAAAARLFGATDPVGKTVSFANRVDATVTGVIGPIPEPSLMGRSFGAQLPFDMLTSMDVFDRYTNAPDSGPENWFGMDCQTYVLLPADGSLPAHLLAGRLPDFVHRHTSAPQQAFGTLLLSLTPVSDVFAVNAAGIFFGGDVSVPTLLLLFGALVLGVACVNYSNLATAQVAGRAREAGVRKAIGAGPGQIVLQHLLEAGLLTTLALLAALVAARALAPALESVTGIDIGLVLSASPELWLFLSLLTVAVTLLAGAYPALVLSRIQPIVVLRPARVHGRTRVLSKILLGLQFTVASFLLFLLVVVHQENQQLKRMMGTSSIDPILMIRNDAGTTGVAPETLAAELRRLPGVEAVTTTAQPLTASGGNVVARTADPEAPQKTVDTLSVSFDFTEVFGLELLAGRTFDREHAEDLVPFGQGQPNVVIDRTLAERLGFDSPADAVDQVIYIPESLTKAYGGKGAAPMRIIGVTERKPLSFRGGQQGTLYYFANRPSFALARLARNDVDGTVGAIDALWKRLAPGFAVSRRFLDEIFDQQYARYARLDYGVSALTLFALLISAAGLFAMGLLMTVRRTREIGVRKSLGASSQRIVLLLLGDFSLPVVVANVVAWPIAYIAARRYVSVFASQTNLSALLFVATLVITLAIAWLAVGVQTLRAAHTNPAQALRHE